MARYIDADKLALKWMIASPKQRELFRQIIDEEPPADVVEVVRCKDCRFNVSNMEKSGFDTTDYSGDDIVCSMHMSDGFKETDFCSYGQRSNT